MNGNHVLENFYLVKEAEKVNIYEPGYARKAPLRAARAMSGSSAIETLLKANRKIRNQRSLKKQAALENFYLVKESSKSTAAKDVWKNLRWDSLSKANSKLNNKHLTEHLRRLHIDDHFKRQGMMLRPSKLP